MRLFVGIWPDDATAAVLADLHRPTAPGLRWTTPDQWHVTLRFCGDVDDLDVPDLVGVLRTALADQAPVTLELGPAISGFDGGHLVHAPVVGCDELAARVHAALAGVGTAPEPGPFAGHLTLARTKHGPPPGLVGTPVAGSWRSDEVCVVSSRTDPDGARYRTEVTIPLVG